MKTVLELIEGDKTPPKPEKMIPSKHKPHHLNLNMSYNGGKRGRKSDEERQQLLKDFRFKVEQKICYLFFD